MIAITILALIAGLLALVAMFPQTDKFPALAVGVLLLAIALFLAYPLR